MPSTRGSNEGATFACGYGVRLTARVRRLSAQESLAHRGRYTYTALPGDQKFRIVPLGRYAAGWRYDRRKTLVSCLAGASLRVDLHILGVMID